MIAKMTDCDLLRCLVDTVKLRSALPRLKTPLDMIDRPVAAIIFAMILIVLALHLRTLVKEWRAYQPDKDHDLHDSQTR